MRLSISRTTKNILLLAVAAIVIVSLMFAAAGVVRANETIQLRWEFEENGGATVLDSSSDNNGTIYNGATRGTGSTGFGVSLNGVNQYIQSNAPLASLGSTNTPYALSAWVRVPAGVSSGNIVHISSSPTGSGWCIPFLRLQEGVFRATGWDGGAVSAASTTTVEPDRWYQVMTTWDSENGLRLFVDGVLEDSSPQSTFNAYGAPVYVSVGLSNNNCSEDQGYLQGEVDDIRVYDRVIQPEDVQDIINPETTGGSDGDAVGVDNESQDDDVSLAPGQGTSSEALLPGVPNTGVKAAEYIDLGGLAVVGAGSLATLLLIRRKYS